MDWENGTLCKPALKWKWKPVRRNTKKEFTFWSLGNWFFSSIDMHSTPFWELCSLAKRAVGEWAPFSSTIKNSKWLIKPRAGSSLDLVERASRLEKNATAVFRFSTELLLEQFFCLVFHLKFSPKRCCSATHPLAGRFVREWFKWAVRSSS